MIVAGFEVVTCPTKPIGLGAASSARSPKRSSVAQRVRIREVSATANHSVRVSGLHVCTGFEVRIPLLSLSRHAPRPAPGASTLAGRDFTVKLVEEIEATNQISGEVRGQNLDGDGAVEARVAGTIHLVHTACTERREDFVRTKFCT